MSPDYIGAALFENRFWLQILGDHARFIFNSLSPKELAEIKKAQYFIQVFDQLLSHARANLSEAELIQLNRQANSCAQEIRKFKLDLIKQQLVGDITIGLPPTFINHMVNEVEDYLTVIQTLLAQQMPVPKHPINQHLIWLIDAAGHAYAISGAMDMVEKEIIKKSNEFGKRFEELYTKAIELAGYMRSSVTQFPALSRLNYQVEREILCFKEFLKELESLKLEQRVLGSIDPLMLDHMAREECYYLVKLAMVSEVNKPSCDPTKPRTRG